MPKTTNQSKPKNICMLPLLLFSKKQQYKINQWYLSQLFLQLTMLSKSHRSRKFSNKKPIDCYVYRDVETKIGSQEAKDQLQLSESKEILVKLSGPSRQNGD